MGFGYPECKSQFNLNEGKETFMEVVRNKNNSWLSQSSKGPGSANKLIADRLEELKQEAPVPDEEDF